MAEKIIETSISKEMETSFLDYAMSVIVARALPDVRDGMKPVHRRVVYAMYELGLTPSSSYKKSARVVGDVMGKYHPHGDTAIYETLVRMAQDFSYRNMLVNGHGNFGSLDGDSPAAMRYTECRLQKISMEMIRDINKDTVDFIDNYDASEREPSVLPSRFPNVLVNGTTGIAVGMATNIPPHNLGEVVDAIISYMDNEEITISELMTYIKGPDFPTGASILGNSGIKKAYETGRGIITLRAKTEIVEKSNGKHSIIVTEIPYQVTKSSIVEKIANLARDKIVEGISDLVDESNRDGIKIVIDLKREANPNIVLNNLYKHTTLQNSFGINLLMLVNGEPKTLNLKQIIAYYTDFQREIIVRRTKFDLKKAENRAHILEGLKIALDNIDAVVKLIKKAKSELEAVEGLISNFGLTEIQAKSIMEMKLRRLTGLERDKIENELKELAKLIEELKKILASDKLIDDIIKKELLEIRDKYADPRRSVIDLTAIDYIEDESLIPVENIMISLTKKGYIKRLNVDTYRSQNRGGVGIKGMGTNEDDFVKKSFTCLTHDYILFFTNLGKVYRIKGYEIPEFSRQSKGLPIVNLLPLVKGEIVNSIVALSKEDDLNTLMFFTKKGLVKRTKVTEFESIRKNGKIAIGLKENDELVAVKKTNGDNDIMIASDNGRMVRFNENEARIMGRNASGVRGIQIDDEYKVVGAEIANINEQVLVITEKGYGKKTKVDEYRLTHRGSKGVKALNMTDKNGLIVAFKSVVGDEDVIITSDSGIVIRMSVDHISTLKRNTQGVRVMNLKEKQKITTVTIVDKEELEKGIE